MNSSKRITGMQKKGYLWITLGFFLISICLHWFFGWKTFLQEQQELHLPVHVSDYLNQMMRDTMENWQSEFLQLIWQVAGLAYFLYVGSPQSREGDERKEEKLDYIIRKLDPEKYDQLMKEWEEKFPKN
jgi:hypothetical protein